MMRAEQPSSEKAMALEARNSCQPPVDRGTTVQQSLTHPLSHLLVSPMFCHMCGVQCHFFI